MLRSPDGVSDRAHVLGRPGQRAGMVEVDDTQLGRTLQLTRNSAPIALINAQGRSQQAMIGSIHCSVEVPGYPAGINSGRYAPVIGLLTWGQGGANFKAKIDLRTGLCCSVVASTVTLNVVYEATAVTPDPRAEVVNVSAALVWGTRPSGARVTRTLPAVTLAPAASATFEVPVFAYAVCLYSTNPDIYDPASTSLITMHGGPLVADDPELIIPAGVLDASAIVNDGIQLSGNTRFVTFTNNEAGAVTIRPTFLLAL